MTEKFDLPVEELSSEEWEELKNMYEVISEHVRIGQQKYLVPIKYVSMASDIYNLKLRPDDITVASYQRSGTTWTQELVWLIANNLDYEKAAAIPLTQRYPFLELAVFIDENLQNAVFENCSEEAKKLLQLIAIPATEILPSLPSPRFIKTHLPMSLLPPTLVDMTKVVYVARDPRDVAVSCYHHARLFKMSGFKASFKQMWNAFIKNLFILTPYFDHVKEAWSLRHHPNMLFLFYEELSKDLPATIRRVAAFLGKEVTPAQMNRLVEHLKIDNFKNNKSVNYDEMRAVELLDKNESFVRKGKPGGWRDYFDEEMCSQAERWIADNLRDTDLRFPSMM